MWLGVSLGVWLGGGVGVKGVHPQLRMYGCVCGWWCVAMGMGGWL